MDWYWSIDGEGLMLAASREDAIAGLVAYFKHNPKKQVQGVVGKVVGVTAESCLMPLTLEGVLERMNDEASDTYDQEDGEVFRVVDEQAAQTHLSVLNEAILAWANKYIKSDLCAADTEEDVSAEVSAAVLS